MSRALAPARRRRGAVRAAPPPGSDPADLAGRLRHLRGRELTDDLVDLLIETIHHIGARAERRVERELLDDLKRVTGKQTCCSSSPTPRSRSRTGPCARSSSPWSTSRRCATWSRSGRRRGRPTARTLRTVIRNSYRGALPAHGARNPRARWTSAPTTQRIGRSSTRSAWCAATPQPRLRHFPAEEDGAARRRRARRSGAKPCRAGRAGPARVNRITYEICVLEALREQLRCKEIWVAGANRYRNPDEDLPADFEARRDDLLRGARPAARRRTLHRGAAGPRCARRCRRSTPGCRQSATCASAASGRRLDHGHAARRAARAAQPGCAQGRDPSDWPMTSLLDMVKEADLRLGFTDALRSPTAYENLDRAVLQAAAAAVPARPRHQRRACSAWRGLTGVTYKDLLYVRRRYHHASRTARGHRDRRQRHAAARNPPIWGDGTTACARTPSTSARGTRTSRPSGTSATAVAAS